MLYTSTEHDDGKWWLCMKFMVWCKYHLITPYSSLLSFLDIVFRFSLRNKQTTQAFYIETYIYL